MLEIYSYEYARAANDERRTRALNRYERLSRRTDGTEWVAPTSGAEVVAITFASGCPESDRISA
jgi:hypothetical protein